MSNSSPIVYYTSLFSQRHIRCFLLNYEGDTRIVLAHGCHRLCLKHIYQFHTSTSSHHPQVLFKQSITLTRTLLHNNSLALRIQPVVQLPYFWVVIILHTRLKMCEYLQTTFSCGHYRLWQMNKCRLYPGCQVEIIPVTQAALCSACAAQLEVRRREMEEALRKLNMGSA